MGCRQHGVNVERRQVIFTECLGEEVSTRGNNHKFHKNVEKEYVEKSISSLSFFMCVAVSEAALHNVPHELNVPYGPKNTQQLDIFGTSLPDGEYKTFPFIKTCRNIF